MMAHARRMVTQVRMPTELMSDAFHAAGTAFENFTGSLINSMMRKESAEIMFGKWAGDYIFGKWAGDYILYHRPVGTIEEIETIKDRPPGVFMNTARVHVPSSPDAVRPKFGLFVTVADDLEFVARAADAVYQLNAVEDVAVVSPDQFSPTLMATQGHDWAFVVVGPRFPHPNLSEVPSFLRAHDKAVPPILIRDRPFQFTKDHADLGFVEFFHTEVGVDVLANRLAVIANPVPAQRNAPYRRCHTVTAGSIGGREVAKFVFWARDEREAQAGFERKFPQLQVLKIERGTHAAGEEGSR